MNDRRLYEIELELVDWSQLRDVSSGLKDPPTQFADYIPEAVIGLLNATDDEEAEKYYWRLENHVVVQGNPFEAAEPLVSVLVASLYDDQPEHVRSRVLELIFQMVVYESTQDKGVLTEKCRVRARNGLWLLYKLYLETPDETSDTLSILLDKIETDLDRLAAFFSIKKPNSMHTTQDR